jgi:phospholipase C
MSKKRIYSFNPGMMNPALTRRRFLVSAAGIAAAAGFAGALPEALARAASTSPRWGGGDLSQVQHVVYLMQENRSFDHYFGTFPGVRGFADPRAARLPNGMSVFRQPDPANPDSYLEPYHMSTITTGAAAVPSLSHDWRDQHAAWNLGANDSWLPAHIASDGIVNGSFTMGYYEQPDIPFHWALAQAFTIADNYHCSVLGPTYPNRAVWESGTNDPQGTGGGPILETVTPNPLTFESGAETLYNAGISFKYYFNTEWLPIYTGSWFAKFQTPGLVDTALYNAVKAPGTLYGDGTPGGIGDPDSPTPASNPDLAFEEDCANGVLPAVSFLGTNASEHPPAIPAAGAQFLATKLEALAANEDLWNTTVFVINYDENDGFFDHVVPPTPSIEEYPEEFVHLPSPKGTPGGGLPVGGGFRVPAWIISPWTVGGNVFSEVSDHTSGLQFIEAVAGAGGFGGAGSVTFPNISRWRRATFGDFSRALRPGAVQPAPSNTQFDPATRAADLAAQQAASTQPQTPRPGATQSFPYRNW